MSEEQLQHLMEKNSLQESFRNQQGVPPVNFNSFDDLSVFRPSDDLPGYGRVVDPTPVPLDETFAKDINDYGSNSDYVDDNENEVLEAELAKNIIDYGPNSDYVDNNENEVLEAELAKNINDYDSISDYGNMVSNANTGLETDLAKNIYDYDSVDYDAEPNTVEKNIIDLEVTTVKPIDFNDEGINVLSPETFLDISAETFDPPKVSLLPEPSLDISAGNNSGPEVLSLPETFLDISAEIVDRPEVLLLPETSLDISAEKDDASEEALLPETSLDISAETEDASTISLLPETSLDISVENDIDDIKISFIPETNDGPGIQLLPEPSVDLSAENQEEEISLLPDTLLDISAEDEAEIPLVPEISTDISAESPEEYDIGSAITTEPNLPVAFPVDSGLLPIDSNIPDFDDLDAAVESELLANDDGVVGNLIITPEYHGGAPDYLDYGPPQTVQSFMNTPMTKTLLERIPVVQE